MNKRFEGQIAIVTGGARGIGEGIAQRLGQEGARLVLLDVQEEAVKATVRRMQSEGLKVESMSLNISDEAQVRFALNKVAHDHGRIDIMVNSAGIIGPTSTPIEDYAYHEFQQVVEVNLNGSFLMTKYVIPHMVERQYGRILLLSSIGGKEGNPGMVGYAASKSGVMGLVKGVGKEYANQGITVNGLAPAVIATPMNLDTDPQMLDYMTRKIPMGRLGKVEEVAALACWIVSKEASFNTGVVFDMSGGRATF